MNYERLYDHLLKIDPGIEIYDPNNSESDTSAPTPELKGIFSALAIVTDQLNSQCNFQKEILCASTNTELPPQLTTHFNVDLTRKHHVTAAIYHDNSNEVAIKTGHLLLSTNNRTIDYRIISINPENGNGEYQRYISRTVMDDKGIIASDNTDGNKNLIESEFDLVSQFVLSLPGWRKTNKKTCRECPIFNAEKQQY